MVVPRTGLEPARLSTLAPETSASTIPPPGHSFRRRAENEARTRDPDLGKVVLYQLSYFRVYHVILPECVAKVRLFFESANFSGNFLQKKAENPSFFISKP
jgi:hypothetical protein